MLLVMLSEMIAPLIATVASISFRRASWASEGWLKPNARKA
jgi:hypothetical protein